MQQKAGLAPRSAEDDALEAILALDDIWETAHRRHVWHLDRRGEGPSLVTLRTLGLFDSNRTADTSRRGSILARLLAWLGDH